MSEMPELISDATPCIGHQIDEGVAGVIFDLNGVLVEDEPLHEATFAAALAPHGVRLTHELYQATILGQTDALGVARLAAACQLALPTQSIVHAKELLYRERLRAEGSRYVAGGAVPLIEALARRGLHLALASASPAIEVFAWLTVLGFDQAAGVFDPIVTSESPPAPKPDPAVYETIVATWDIPPQACAVIDDHPENIAIAYTLGMRAIAIASTLPPSAFPHTHLIAHSLADL